MNPLAEISAEIDDAARQRAELLRALSGQHDRQIIAACARLDRRLAGLWEARRLLRARLRYGEAAEIKQRARHEERVLRSA
jgi:hypothetical protein